MTERSWTILITLAVLFVASLSIFHLGPTFLPEKGSSGPAIMASGIPQVTPAMVQAKNPLLNCFAREGV
jgi:hypothetical protein